MGQSLPPPKILAEKAFFKVVNQYNVSSNPYKKPDGPEANDFNGYFSLGATGASGASLSSYQINFTQTVPVDPLIEIDKQNAIGNLTQTTYPKPHKA